MIKNNINRIFLFGDSFVEGQGTYQSISEDGEFIEPNLPFGDGPNTIREWRRNNSWNKFIKDITGGCNVVNEAIQGSDNYTQFSILNKWLPKLTKNDLVIFGFTSKLRDSGFSVKYGFTQLSDGGYSLLHTDNPLGKQVAWEKNLIEIERYCTDMDGHAMYKDDIEKKFTKEYVEDFFATIYNQQVYETVAQANYLFYQNWFKQNGLNICFFDIFEKYIDENYILDGYESNIDKDVYVSYKSKSLTDVLYEYEDKNVKEGDVGVWEWGYYKPELTMHANQHGYKVFIDYLFDNFLNKKYEFQANTI